MKFQDFLFPTTGVEVPPRPTRWGELPVRGLLVRGLLIRGLPGPGPLLWGLLVMGAITSGCGRAGAVAAEAAMPQAPQPIEIEEGATYEQRADATTEGLDEICKIDPTACPSLDLSKEAARSVGEPLTTYEQASTRSTRRRTELMSASDRKLSRKERDAAPAAPSDPSPQQADSDTAIDTAVASEVEEASLEQTVANNEAMPANVEISAAANAPGAVQPLTAAQVRQPAANKDRKDAAAMQQVEARLELVVPKIAAALDGIKAAVVKAGGQVVNEVVEDSSNSYGAALTIRVSSDKTQTLLDSIENSGRLLSRKITAEDVGRKYFDAQVLLNNLQATLARYEQLLSEAGTLTEMLQLETSMGRVRTQINRVKGDLRWMRDRVDRSTIYVSLRTDVVDQGTVELEPKMWPGVRGVSVVDFVSAGNTDVYLGAGFSVLFTRHLSIDLDLARALTDSATTSAGTDYLSVTIGGDAYSDLLGGGERRWFNPYLGLRVGFVRARDVNEFAIGGTLGAELYKSRRVLLDLQLRSYALMGSQDYGLHATLTPALGLNVAF